MGEDTPVGRARGLVEVLDWMQDNNLYDDRSTLDRMDQLNAELRPAWQYFFGGFPMISHVTYPVSAWFPRIWESARGLLAQLEANPTWGPSDSVTMTRELNWVPERLWTYVEGSVAYARATGDAAQWGKVTADATRFLENEIRARTGLNEVNSRQDLAAQAFKPGGLLDMKKGDASLQESWMYLLKGVFGAFANPAAHTIRLHSETFAMGVIGAVSVILVTMDDEIGPPPSPLTDT